ncbi:MAG: CpsD/CapB family tyrosine-protein kinase [Bacilli bacterium]
MNISELIVENNPKSSVSEAIKAIRTNLQFSSIDKKLKTVLVTSSIPSEGKSFISCNLATAFVQDGNKVLLVDCDMRKGRQHKVFQVNNEKGLSTLLLGPIDKDNIANFIQKTKVENLFLLTMGIVPPNPSELLNSDNMKKLIDLLSSEFDLVIFDGVPVNGLTDSVVMSKLVDKVVIVSAMKQTPIELLAQTKKTLENANADIAGVIVNKVPNKNGGYYYGNYGNYYM